MMRAARHAAMHFAFPKNFAALPVDRVNHPAVLVARSAFTIATEIEAFLGRFGLDRADDRCDKDAIAPDHRRRPAASGDSGFPHNVARGAPGVGQRRIFSDARRLRTAKLRPVVTGLERYKKTEQDGHESSHGSTVHLYRGS